MRTTYPLIRWADMLIRSHEGKKPADCNPGTTVHLLVKELTDPGSVTNTK
ncbi:hypothetical protein [Bacteroides sp. UBA939]|nr:hypothetical protein [Bacteroides sp. UBA939]